MLFVDRVLLDERGQLTVDSYLLKKFVKLLIEWFFQCGYVWALINTLQPIKVWDQSMSFVIFGEIQVQKSQLHNP